MSCDGGCHGASINSIAVSTFLSPQLPSPTSWCSSFGVHCYSFSSQHQHHHHQSSSIVLLNRPTWNTNTSPHYSAIWWVLLTWSLNANPLNLPTIHPTHYIRLFTTSHQGVDAIMHLMCCILLWLGRSASNLSCPGPMFSFTCNWVCLWLSYLDQCQFHVSRQGANS